MEQLEKLTIEVSRCQDSYGAPYTRPKVWIRGELKEHGGGVNYISFLLIGDEWFELFQHGGTFSDGYNLLRTFGESWTFYRLDQVPRESSGAMSVPFTRITMPRDIRTRIADDIKDELIAFDAQAPNKYGDKDALTIDYSGKLEEWSTEHGQGKGSIEIDADSETRDKLGSLAGEETFDRCWTTIENLAKNTTHKRSDVGVIQVYRDHGGFFWRAGGLHGGLINHGSDSEPDWSVHT